MGSEPVAVVGVVEDVVVCIVGAEGVAEAEGAGVGEVGSVSTSVEAVGTDGVVGVAVGPGAPVKLDLVGVGSDGAAELGGAGGSEGGLCLRYGGVGE